MPKDLDRRVTQAYQRERQHALIGNKKGSGVRIYVDVSVADLMYGLVLHAAVKRNGRGHANIGDVVATARGDCHGAGSESEQLALSRGGHMGVDDLLECRPGG